MKEMNFEQTLSKCIYLVRKFFSLGFLEKKI